MRRGYRKRAAKAEKFLAEKWKKMRAKKNQ
jgi:hypothetical protein